MPADSESTDPWPALAYSAWSDTAKTLHMWTQIVGKVRLALSPWVNHSWHVTLYPTPRGLTTGAMPMGPRSLELAFDFIGHRLNLMTSDDRHKQIELRPRSVASFYRELMELLAELDCTVEFSKIPNEVPEPIPFDRDEAHASYDPVYARRFSTALSSAARVFSEFRAGFLGKASPVHFFWGSFDLAVTRFSGRVAPPHPGGVPGLPDWVTREAYSHEVSSAGFWPGSDESPPLFYSYAYPTPEAFAGSKVEPPEATFSPELGEFVLPYDVVRGSPKPEETLRTFLRSTYDAAATTGNWNRESLEFVSPVSLR